MPKAVIIGAGIAGLAAGIAFKRAGWSVDILERAARIEPLGAALSLWPNALAALAALDLTESVARAAEPIRAMLLADMHGRPIIERRIPAPALMITRAALQASLLQKLGQGEVTLGCAVDSIDTRGVVTLEDGSTHTGDIVIDGAGIRSVSRHGTEPSYAGYGGVLALTDPIERSGFAGLAAEYWGDGERFGVFDLPQNRRYWFYMRSQAVDGAMPDLAECLGRSAGWPTRVSESISATREASLIPFAVHANAPPRRLGENRLVRVGDAAHAMEPNLGQGACQGLEDAAALQFVARTTDPSNIAAAYQRLRLKRVRMIVQESSRARFGVHGPGAIQRIIRTALRALPGPVSERRIAAVQTMPNYAELMSGN